MIFSKHILNNYLPKLLFLSLLASTAFAYSGGTGQPNDPYRIADVNDLLALAAAPADYNKCFILTADINMVSQTFTKAVIAPDINSLSGFQGTIFTGTFDGSGHKIINLTINGPGNSFLGLFGYIGSDSDSQIKNLGFENFSVSGSGYYVGGLVGWNWGSIGNCYSTGTVSGSSGSGYVGGLVGCNYDGGSISNCYSTSAVNGSFGVGGLVGANNSGGSISNCYSTGTVNSDNISAGGLVGNNYYGSISNCYSTGAVSGYNYVGGLAGVGDNGGSISNCYSTGTVSGTHGVGGLIGANGSSISISNCYSTGAVSGSSGSDDVGGLVGWNTWGTISNCYSTGAVSGTSRVGGLVGLNSNGGITNNSFWDVNTSGRSTSAGGTGKTTAEMKTLSTFTSAGWDFSYSDGDKMDWFIQIDEYPILTWQISPADLYTDGKNNFRDFAVLARFWMRDDCRRYNSYCQWADLNFDGVVDIDDLAIFMTYWLQSGIYN